MITEALLVANLAMLSVFAYRAIGATKAELRLKEIELDEQLGIGPVEEDCRALEPGNSETTSHLRTVQEIGRLLYRPKDAAKPRRWSGLPVDKTPYWYWLRTQEAWKRFETAPVISGNIIVPGRFPEPTEHPPESIEETDDIAWLRGS